MSAIMVSSFIQSIQNFVKGDGWKELKSMDLKTMWYNVRHFGVNDVDWANVNYSFVLLGTVFLGFVGMIIAAQFTPDYKAPGMNKVNMALGSDQAKKNKDAPPIPPPTEVVALRVYPIKSCRGFEVDSSRLRKMGLTLDRNWMLVGNDRKFLTIRSDPSMTLIDTALVDGPKGEQMLEVSIHGFDGRITVPAFPSKQWLEANTTLSQVEIWEQDTDAWDYGAEINKFFCDYFQKDVALVYKGPSKRINAVNGSPDLYGQEVPHHFADVVSLQIASEASIKDLNRRLQEKDVNSTPLTIERFRPNIIVRGREDHPWEEDTWKRIRITTTLPNEEAIYKVDLDAVARCARCQVPNVNPTTAEKHPKEPWDELMKFRRVDTGGVAKYKPCFGMLCISRNEGKIKVGATLEVLETTDKHLYNIAKFEDL
ncbi:MOSC-domain-containing protein [Teratosphaeria nubilosa]|uniref:MOSC-domain-containing protein n=1 Tax=Teratosphaeria nubilosa TaxID=161662 RepID=A0A6G1LK60_9PEZI|nr:MOSC-domain-containing protein [Teratosphaeria nubilosa]